MASDRIRELDDGSFAEAIREGVVLVDFWAPWCGPCRFQGPILEDVAESAKGAVSIAKVNVDQAPRAANQFGIRAIPTLMLFNDGEAVEQWLGVQQAPTLLEAVERYTG